MMMIKKVASKTKGFGLAALAATLVMMSSGMVVSQEASRRPVIKVLTPIRVIEDPYPVFIGIGVNTETDEVVISDNNRAALLTYDRLTQTEGVAEPLRQIIGPKTLLGDVCGLSIDPMNQEIYVVDNDSADTMSVFSRESKGDVSPKRALETSHGAWGVFLDRDHDELAITIEHNNQIAVYRRMAEGDEATLRIIQGSRTQLADPHGIFVDSLHDEIAVTNHGHWHLVQTGEGETIGSQLIKTAEGYQEGGDREALLGPPALPYSTGKFLPPSITVYRRLANGNVEPLRSIQGPRTKLNLPLGIWVDTIRDEIIVANNDDAILFFSRTANGDVAPLRVIQGSFTQLSSPSGIFLDTKNEELWVANYGNHRATVYPITAQGNVAPLRVIRSASSQAPTTGVNSVGNLAYDPVRKQILVPN